MAPLIVKQISEIVRELRLFSLGAFVFAAVLLYEVVTWVTTRSEPAAIGDGIAVTGVIGALVGLCKFIFEFAIRKSDPVNTKENSKGLSDG